MTKRDSYKRSHVYWFYLPKQSVEEKTDGIARARLGVEQCDAHACVVMSDDDWNTLNGRGIIVVPLTSAEREDRSRKKKESTWVQVYSQGEFRYALCEQIRYVDQSRWTTHDCGEIDSYHFNEVVKKLRELGIAEIPAVKSSTKK